MNKNDEWATNLQNEFPFMKQTVNQDNHAYQHYGFECAGGWYNLLRSCFLRITEKYEQAEREIDFIPRQIKQKFGGLRIYYGFKDKSLKFESHEKNDDKETLIFRQQIADIIRETVEQSIHICEFCGQKGSLRMDLVWKRTLCEKCYNDQIKRKNNRIDYRQINGHRLHQMLINKTNK